MKKYIVRVQYSNKRKDNLIYTLKAKNDFDLERKMAIELNDILDDIDGIEYDLVYRWTFSRKENNLFCGGWIGSLCLKELLEKNKKVGLE